jgi:hypothetical protein
MIEDEIQVELSLDTSRFIAALEHAQFVTVLAMALTPRDRLYFWWLGRVADLFEGH